MRPGSSLVLGFYNTFLLHKANSPKTMCCIWVGLAKSMTKNKPEGLAAGADRTMRWVLKGWQDWQLGVGGILVN